MSLTLPEDTQAGREPRDLPNIERLRGMMRDDILDWATLGRFDRIAMAHRTRECLWNQKTDDGLYAGDQPFSPGKQFFPWAGAPDHESRLVDGQIGTVVDLRLMAWWMGQRSIRPRDVMDNSATRKAQAWHRVIEFQLSQAKIQRTDALELFWNCIDEMGYCVWSEGWMHQWRRGRKFVSFTDIVEMVQNQLVDASMQHGVPVDPSLWDNVVPALLMEVMDPMMTPLAVQRLKQFDPLMPDDEAKKVLLSWRRNDMSNTVYYAPVPRPGRADPRALIPGIDVLFPAVTQSGQVPRFWWFPWFTEAEILQMAVREDWDEQWTEDLLAKPGQVVDWTQMSQAGMSSQNGWELNALGMSYQLQSSALKNAGLYQVAVLWRVGVDQMGLPSPYRTILHGMVDGCATDQCDPMGTGESPLVLFRREAKSNVITGTQGMAHELITHQLMEKQLTDAVGSQAMLRAAPPVIDTMDAGADGLKPFARIAVSNRTSRPGAAFQFLEVPEVSPEVVAFMELNRERVYDFNKTGPKVDPDEKRARKLRHLNRACVFYEEMLRLLSVNTRQDVKQSGDLALGSVNGVQVNQLITATDLEGELDITHKCDLAATDIELLEQKIKMVAQVLPFDRSGTADMNRIFRVLLGWIDIDLMSTSVQDLQQATENEMREIDRLIANIVTGSIVTDDELMKDAGNPSLRLDRLHQWMSLQENQQILQARPLVAEQMDKLLQHYQFQIDQQQNNPIIGRVAGVSPQLASAMPAPVQPQPQGPALTDGSAGAGQPAETAA